MVTTNKQTADLLRWTLDLLIFHALSPGRSCSQSLKPYTQLKEQINYVGSELF